MMQKKEAKSANMTNSNYKLVVYEREKRQGTHSLVFYSFPKEDGMGLKAVRHGLYHRILQKKMGMNFFMAYLVPMASDPGLPIDKAAVDVFKGHHFYQANPKTNDNRSTIKLVVYDALNGYNVFSPIDDEVGKNHQFIMGSMQNRILKGQFHNRFRSALFVNKENDKVILKLIGQA